MHRNLLFDLDQTLLNFHASEHIALKKIMTYNRLAFTKERYGFFQQTNKKLWLEFEKEKITKTELFDMRFRRLFEKCGRDTNGVDFLKINSDFIDCMLHSGVAMEGACDFIKKVAVNIPDVRIYIITNGAERNARGRLASTGMNAYVCEMFVSETMGTAKPSREFFDIVKKAIGEPDESCIVIGDSLTSDMLGARNSGLVSCWFMPEGNIEEAVKEYDINYTASSFDELYEVITRWSVTCFPYTALEDQ